MRLFALLTLVAFVFNSGCNTSVYSSFKAREKMDITVSDTKVVLDTLKAEHPRLIAHAADFDRVASLIKTDKFAADWYGFIKGQADSLLDKGVREYEIPDGRRLLAVSREVLHRVTVLSLVCRIENDSKYARRVWAELESAGNFKDWNPSHFLDTAEMCLAFAIGYDWLYDQWTPQQRDFIAEAITSKALNEVLEKGYETDGWLTRISNNWNQVCNAGMLAGALAIAEHDREKSAQIVCAAINSLPVSMTHYAPDGAWEEGPMYWSYGTSFNVTAIAVLESALGSDFGLSRASSFDQTWKFPVYMTSPIAKVFNFCDCSDHSIVSPPLLWFASRFDAPVAADYFREMILRRKKLSAGRMASFGLLWYDPNITVADGEEVELLNIKFNRVECAAFRENFTDDNGMFLAFKAGRPMAGHGQIDTGSFIFDALGQRWAMDLGSGDYNAPGYFNGGVGGKRWSYYRMRAEGHNTLVINPADTEDQKIDSESKIISYDDSRDNPSATLDLTPAYSGYGVESVKRSFELKSTGGERFVTITDHIEPISGNPADIWWFMHTEADIEIASDGKSATLSQNGKIVNAKLSGSASAKFTKMAAKPLPSSPNPDRAKDNNGVGKLAVHMENVSEAVELQVRLIPAIEK